MSYKVGQCETLKWTAEDLGIGGFDFDGVEVDARTVGTSTTSAWAAIANREDHFERQRLLVLRQHFTAEEWPELHARKFTTPEGFASLSLFVRRVFADAVKEMRLVAGGVVLQRVEGPAAYDLADRLNVWMEIGLRIRNEAALRPPRPSSPASSDATGEGETSSVNSPNSTTITP